MNDTHRDTVDCLLSELKDAYDVLLGGSTVSGELTMVCVESAIASIERAFQLVSDLKAAQS